MSDLKQDRMLLGAAEKDVSALRGMDDAAVFADDFTIFRYGRSRERAFELLR